MTFKNTVKLCKVAALAAVVSIAVPTAVQQVVSPFGLTVTGVVAEAADAKKKKKRRKLPGIDQAFFKEMSKAQEFVSPNTEENPEAKADFPAALKQLKKMEKKCVDKCNKYELSQIYRFYAFTYYSLDDMPKAIKYYDLVVQQSPQIPLGIEKNTLYTLAQLAFQESRYDDSLEYLNRSLALSDEVRADDYYLMATINYQKGAKDAALKAINSAIKLVEGRGKTPKENWYNIKTSVLLEKEDYKAALPVVEKLIVHYSKPTYWTQLGGLYGLLGKSTSQLAAMDVNYLSKGLKKEQELMNLAYLYIGEGAPYEAAKIISKGIEDGVIRKNTKNMEPLALAWGRAKETKKAVKVLDEAAKIAKTEPLKDPKKDKRKTGDLYALQAGFYLDLNDNKNAIKSAKNAIKAGSLKDPGATYTNLGIAYVDMKQYGPAINAFGKAMKSKKHKRFAANWKKYAEKELAREKALASDS